VFTFDTPQRRKYVCAVCGVERIILTKPIEKWVTVCLHADTRGSALPIMALREEGQLVRD